MAKDVKVVGGPRSMADRAVSSPEGAAPNPSPSKRKKWEFQSYNDRLQLSLEERTVHYLPGGSMRESYPKTKNGSRLDTIRFEDNYFGTDDDLLAKRMMESSLYGLPANGGAFWLRSDMAKVQEAAEVAELRRRLANNPELARQVLTPSDSEDFKLPPAI